MRVFPDEDHLLGYEVDRHWLHKTQEKIHAFVNAPRLENVQQFRSFLGLVNYYHKFLPNLATTLNPLNGLLEQGKRWKWTTECEEGVPLSKEADHIGYGAHPL